MRSVAQPCPTLCDLVDAKAPLSMGFSRPEYWSGLPCPPPGDLVNPGVEPESLVSPALADRFFTTSASWEAVGCSEQLLDRPWTQEEGRSLSWVGGGGDVELMHLDSDRRDSKDQGLRREGSVLEGWPSSLLFLECLSVCLCHDGATSSRCSEQVLVGVRGLTKHRLSPHGCTGHPPPATCGGKPEGLCTGLSNSSSPPMTKQCRRSL